MLAACSRPCGSAPAFCLRFMPGPCIARPSPSPRPRLWLPFQWRRFACCCCLRPLPSASARALSCIARPRPRVPASACQPRAAFPPPSRARARLCRRARLPAAPVVVGPRLCLLAAFRLPSCAPRASAPACLLPRLCRRAPPFPAPPPCAFFSPAPLPCGLACAGLVLSALWLLLLLALCGLFWSVRGLGSRPVGPSPYKGVPWACQLAARSSGCGLYQGSSPSSVSGL
jgi:hypothetical protein